MCVDYDIILPCIKDQIKGYCTIRASHAKGTREQKMSVTYKKRSWFPLVQSMNYVKNRKFESIKISCGKLA